MFAMVLPTALMTLITGTSRRCASLTTSTSSFVSPDCDTTINPDFDGSLWMRKSHSSVLSASIVATFANAPVCLRSLVP